MMASAMRPGLLIAGVVGVLGCRAAAPKAPEAAPAGEPTVAAAGAPVPEDTTPPPRGEQELQEAIARDVGDARAWEGLAWLYYQRSADEPGYAILARQVITQGLVSLGRSGRTSADLQVTRGFLELADGKPDAARRDLEAALVLAPHHPRALRLVGQLALTTYDYARARQVFDLLSDLRSGRTDPEVWLALGVAERGLQQLEAAEAAYKQAAALAPADPRVRWNLGLLYIAFGIRDGVNVEDSDRFAAAAEGELRRFLEMTAEDPRFARQRAEADTFIRTRQKKPKAAPQQGLAEFVASPTEAVRIAMEAEDQRLLRLEREALAAEDAGQ